MCRLFGFRSVILSQVHKSLVSADNALGAQSMKHPDGWGVSYYVGSSPHIIKSEKSAMNCSIFEKISGVVSSQTVLAHIRKATLGKKNILNTHPFQFGKWVFAHNGNIKDFSKYKSALLDRVDDSLKRYILGDTDSELLFFLILSFLKKKTSLDNNDVAIKDLNKAIQDTVAEVVRITGPYSEIDNAGETESYFTFLITNGETMAAHQGGKKLYYSTYKTLCSDRDTCASFKEECENATKTGNVNHLIFTSEPLHGENIWLPMKNGQVIGVDKNMKLFSS